MPANPMLVGHDDQERPRTEDETGDFGGGNTMASDVRLVVVVPKEFGHLLHTHIVARRMALPYDAALNVRRDVSVTAASSPRAIRSRSSARYRSLLANSGQYL